MEKILQDNMITPDYEGAAKILRGYKNKYEGKRCFIIGNGPSLKAEDLDKIHENGDFSIASNRIYLIFKDTEWRPNIFTMSDQSGIKGSIDELSNIEAELKIIPVELGLKVLPVAGALMIPHSIEGLIWLLKGEMPSFSDDITKCVYAGKTVTYINIQIAAYMGFKEIILLGVDHSYSRIVHVPQILKGFTDQQIKDYFLTERYVTFTTEERKTEAGQDHFSLDYMNGLPGGSFHMEAATLAYMAAKKYAGEHGIRIANATRGGKLNVFKRIKFDNLFN